MKDNEVFKQMNNDELFDEIEEVMNVYGGMPYVKKCLAELKLRMQKSIKFDNNTEVTYEQYIQSRNTKNG